MSPLSAQTDHPFLRWNAGVQTIAVKCDLCHFLPEGPSCVRACPTNALHLVTDVSLHKQLKTRRELAALSSTDLTFASLPSSSEQR